MKKSALLVTLGLAALSVTADGGWFFLPLLVGSVMIIGGIRLYEKS